MLSEEDREIARDLAVVHNRAKNGIKGRKKGHWAPLLCPPNRSFPDSFPWYSPSGPAVYFDVNGIY